MLRGSCAALPMSRRLDSSVSSVSVAIVGNYPNRPGQLDGGIEAVIDCLSRALAREGVRVSIVSPCADARRTERSDSGGISVYRLPVERFRMSSLFASTKASMRRVLREIDPDVVHCHDLSIETYAALLCGYASVVTVHGVWQENARYSDQGWMPRLRNRLQTRLCERHVETRGTHLISISPYIESYYGHRDASDFSRIANPVPERYFSLPRRAENHRLLYAGRLTRRKGVHDLLDAALTVRQSIPLVLVLAGRWEDTDYCERLKQRITAPPFSDFVKVKGLLSETEMVGEFGRAAALAVPSYQETSPMVIQQAMAARVPVVATTVGGVADLLRDAPPSWLVAPGEPSRLAAAIVSVLSSSQENTDAVAAGRSRADREFREKVVAESTVDAYRRVIGA